MGAALRFRIARIQAGAGWGKSTAARAACTGRSVRWIEVRDAPAESGALAFLLADAFALSRVALAKLLKEARNDDDVRALVEWFCAHRLDLEPLLAIDDLHLLVEDHLSMALLAALIERLHEARWLLISRRALPMPWGDWLASGDASLAVVADDLALEPEEARALLAQQAPHLDEGALRAALSLADGWPIVLRFAQRAAERAGDLIALQAMTREMAFAYLAEQFTSESPQQWRELALIATFARWIDAPLLERCGVANPHAAMRWLRESAFPIHDAPTRISLHDLATEAIVRSATAQERSGILLRLIAALAECDRAGEALDLARTYAPERIDTLLAKEGFGLLDAGRWESVEQALHAVSLDRRRADPMLLGVRAALEAFHGNVDRSERLYIAAIRACSDPEFHSALSRRLSLLYINLARPEALAVIAPVIDEGSAMSRADARSIHALALVVTGNLEEAWREVCAALDDVSIEGEEALVARVSMRAAWVAFHCDLPADAERIAMRALEMARRLGDDALQAMLYSILSSLSVTFHDDLDRAYQYAFEMEASAERDGNRQIAEHARRLRFSIAIECGSEERAATVSATIDSGGKIYRSDFFYAFATATRLGWDRHFSEAARRLASCIGEIHNASEARALVATTAMFLAFAGDRDEAIATIERAKSAPPRTTAIDRNFDIVARTHLAIAEIFVGRPSLALRHLPQRVARAWDRALCETARSIALASPAHAENERYAALAALEAAGRRGFARLLRAALGTLQPRLPVTAGSPTLTEAEMEILRALDRGLSPKQIAESSGRSVATVRAHLRSIFRKFDASNRIEALAIAKRRKFL
uniref:HTH luxR-type domain-containing protein n=1 Tax=mine drainage metagenome TaxID=410659 RepID=E6PJ08_9ZZZZ